MSHKQLTSISWSYHTNARDFFVGLLFVIGVLMLAYNGHTAKEALASKGAALSALVVALFPTAENVCPVPPNPTLGIHGIAATLLFLILIYFCFGPFRERTKGEPGKAGIRAKLYFLCGSIMAVSMLIGLIGKFTLECETVEALNLVYWVEAVSLAAFGIAWIVAGKIIPVIVDEQDALKLFKG